MVILAPKFLILKGTVQNVTEEAQVPTGIRTEDRGRGRFQPAKKNRDLELWCP